jgi:two-component system, LytTR family, response regulator
METPTLFVPKLVLKTPQGHTFFGIDEIVSFESAHNFTIVYALTSDKPILVKHKISTIEKHVAKYPCFFKCHRCHIINTNHIVHFREKVHTLVMKIGEVPISENFTEKFLNEVLVNYDCATE